MPVSIYNHQLSVLDRRLWPFARKSISDWKNEYMPECQGRREKQNCGGFFASVKIRYSAHIRALFVAVKTAQLPISPSKTLLRFAAEIESLAKGPVLDAPCGYGRNAVALASRGCTVVAVDNDRKRLAILEQTKRPYIAANATRNITPGKIFAVCADLNSKTWPFAPSRFAAIVSFHFSIIYLIPSFISALEEGGYIYVETFGGHGENFRVLPKAGQLRKLFPSDMQFRYYKERKVGPSAFDSVAVTLFAQKREAPSVLEAKL
jgi:SAM-dependent methyltransferase